MGRSPRFLRQAQARDAKVVLVITGKGGFGGQKLAGEGRGVLRRQVAALAGRDGISVAGDRI